MKLATAPLDKAAVVARIKSEGAVAVIRTDSVERALGAARAAIAGGFRAIEITFGFSDASTAISKLAENHDLLIGAGTILTRYQVREAVAAGARFLVSPCVLPEVIDAARELQVAGIPGAFTPTEIYTAHTLGADIVKIFPAVKFGPDYLKAVRGPLPNIPIMPTSGVDAAGRSLGRSASNACRDASPGRPSRRPALATKASRSAGESSRAPASSSTVARVGV